MKIPRGQTPERAAYMKAYVASHPKRDRSEYKKEYDRVHREESAWYRECNKERLKLQKAQYYEDNRDELLIKVKVYAETNSEAISVYHAKHYQQNSDRIKANVASWNKENPDKRATYESRRRALKAGNGGSHTTEERLLKFAQLGHHCVYCWQKTKLTIDHIIPLSRGGSDEIDNIVPACHSCNSKKHDKTAEEYLQVAK